MENEQMTKETKAYALGRDACRLNDPKFSNPFKENSYEYKAWLRGYHYEWALGRTTQNDSGSRNQ
jgi:hypothetical protein